MYANLIMARYNIFINNHLRDNFNSLTSCGSWVRIPPGSQNENSLIIKFIYDCRRVFYCPKMKNFHNDDPKYWGFLGYFVPLWRKCVQNVCN